MDTKLWTPDRTPDLGDIIGYRRDGRPIRLIGGGAITNFVPEIWSANLRVPMEKSLVFADPSVVNRDYEGEITGMGDTVHITNLLDPTVRTYDKTTDLTVEDLSDAEIQMLIDQGDYFAFRVNDVDKVQARGDFDSEAMRRAGYLLKDKVDRFIAGLYTATQAGNKVALSNLVSADAGKAGTSSDPGNTVYKILLKLRTRLGKSNVPQEGRYAILDPDLMELALQDSRVVKVNESGDDAALRNGIVARLAGFTLKESNNTYVPTAGQHTIHAGVPNAISYADQIVETEALRSQTRFADIIRGLHVYGAKVTYPDGLATATVTIDA